MRTVAFFAYDGLQLLDLAGPVDVLHAASALGATPAYRSLVVSPDGAAVRSESGVAIAADLSLRQLRRQVEAGETVDTLVVVGGLGSREVIGHQHLLQDLAYLSERTRRTTSVCTGALVLAAAGLLDGYRATSHWAYCEQLAANYPEVEILPDQIYVHDRDRWTSAGVTAGVDLLLALVEADHGRQMAHEVAGWLVVFVRRPGGQAQFSVQLAAPPARTKGIDDLQRWLPDHLTEDLSVHRLAERAAMAPRTFARVFKHETGTTPAVYVERLRVEAARRLLEMSELTVAAVAVSVGFGRPETLHRAFTRRMGTSPDRYRQHFGAAGTSSHNNRTT
jgi:transcriptional regulator GlxA family with amidase domain